MLWFCRSRNPRLSQSSKPCTSACSRLGRWGFGEPKVLNDTERSILMAWAEDYLACAEVGAGMGSGLGV
ncbi:hypothetical protein CLOM_g635 [Closterium sp. NIES-68]|nr:hypothetical protein CLOM_g635 [Closterium sp. NIES-68]GJP65631.1 hypothetical protein CLOP_g22500 [Closterium sp. NIES-67]